MYITNTNGSKIIEFLEDEKLKKLELLKPVLAKLLGGKIPRGINEEFKKFNIR